MVSMMLLNSLYNLGEEELVTRWQELQYRQNLIAEKVLQKQPSISYIESYLWMNKQSSYSFVSWLLTLVGHLENVLFGNEKQIACRCQLSRRSRREALAGLTN